MLAGEKKIHVFVRGYYRPSPQTALLEAAAAEQVATRLILLLEHWPTCHDVWGWARFSATGFNHVQRRMSLGRLLPVPHDLRANM